MDNQSSHSSPITLPGAIVIAGALIAMAIIWVKNPEITKTPPKDEAVASQKLSLDSITAEDHLLGNPEAGIVIVEYSDPSCPFCKMFNETMVKIMNEYGPSGKVAWVYRHWPLDRPNANGQILHKNAGQESQAIECAALVGSNDKFWAYQKHFYSNTPAVTNSSPQGLDQSKLAVFAKDVGLDVDNFNTCLTSGRAQTKVEADFLSGLNLGVSGTPYSIIITSSGENYPIQGAESYENIKTTIDTLLSVSTD